MALVNAYTWSLLIIFHLNLGESSSTVNYNARELEYILVYRGKSF